MPRRARINISGLTYHFDQRGNTAARVSLNPPTTEAGIASSLLVTGFEN